MSLDLEYIKWAEYSIPGLTCYDAMYTNGSEPLKCHTHLGVSGPEEHYSYSKPYEELCCRQ